MLRIYRLLTLAILTSTAWSSYAQNNAGQHTGAWYMYFGTSKISDKLSIHSEAQHRNFQPLANIDQLLLRTGLNYAYKSPNGEKSTITGGYAQIYSYPFQKSQTANYSTEYRIFEQLITNNAVGSINLNHRYRLEQRWVDKDGSTNYFNRARYRLMATIPLFRCKCGDKNKEEDISAAPHKITPGTTYLGIYDEIFVNLEGTNNLAQNRLYFALGHKLNKTFDLQAGYLNQILGNIAYHRLQLAVFINMDFRSSAE